MAQASTPLSSDTNPRLLFSTDTYAAMAQELVELGDIELGRLEHREFPDGERYLRLRTSVAGRRVALLGGTTNDSDTLTLYDLGCAIAKYGARRLTLVIPYFGYSTMERAEKIGEVVTAKSRARLLSSIPMAHHGNEVLLLDLHTAGLPQYFEGSVTPVHLSARNLILQEARRLSAGEPFVMACTDAGRAKWVESLANDLGADAAFVMKRRIDGSTTEITGISANVDGCNVIIYDDMIRTGGSLLEAAAAYQSAGARRISAIATHGLFPGRALERLEQSGLFHEIVCTNSHPRAQTSDSAVLKVRSVAPILHSALIHGYYREL